MKRSINKTQGQIAEIIETKRNKL